MLLAMAYARKDVNAILARGSALPMYANASWS